MKFLELQIIIIYNIKHMIKRRQRLVNYRMIHRKKLPRLREALSTVIEATLECGKKLPVSPLKLSRAEIYFSELGWYRGYTSLAY